MNWKPLKERFGLLPESTVIPCKASKSSVLARIRSTFHARGGAAKERRGGPMVMIRLNGDRLGLRVPHFHRSIAAPRFVGKVDETGKLTKIVGSFQWLNSSKIVAVLLSIVVTAVFFNDPVFGMGYLAMILFAIAGDEFLCRNDRNRILDYLAFISRSAKTQKKRN